jgi:Ras-related protein Rab-18
MDTKVAKVGSKLDKASSRAVTFEEGQALANTHGSHFCEVSAKTRENVRKPFVDVVDQIVKSPHLLESASKQAKGGVVVGGAAQDISGCPC